MELRSQALKNQAARTALGDSSARLAMKCKAKLPGKAGTLLDSEDGGVITWLAFGLVAMFGVATLAVDVGNFYMRQNQLQIAADTAVWGAVSLLPDEVEARAAALNYAAMNLPAAQHGTALQSSDILIGNWDADAGIFANGSSPFNAVQVVVRRTAANGNPVDAVFAQVFNFDSVDIVASATAVKGAAASCVVSLATSGIGLSANSNAGITAADCGMTVNSTDSSALFTDSNATIDVADICVTGNYSEQGSSSISPVPMTGCPQAADPLASLTPPPYGGCGPTGLVLDNYSGAPLSQDVYCGGLEIKNNSVVDFDPGIYVITGGDLFVDSNSTITGDGVAFYLTGGARINFTSNTSVDLTAPATGHLAGILFFQDRSYEVTHFFDSNNISRLEGTIYFPTGTLHSDSNTQIGGGSAYSMYIAKHFELDSNAELVINADYGASGVPLPSGLAGSSNRLVM